MAFPARADYGTLNPGRVFGGPGAAQTLRAPGELEAYAPPLKPQGGARARRSKIVDLLHIGLCFAAPLIIFTAVYGLLSFSMYYDDAGLVKILVGVLFALVLVVGVAAVIAVRRRSGTPDAAWLVVTCVLSLIAWIVALVIGLQNFRVNTEPYMDVLNLNVYPSVDPAAYRGNQLMDAGRITFTPGTQLNLGMSMGFMDKDTYCVAPIVSNLNGTKPAPRSYDFWAVGINCCSGSNLNFHCGDWNQRKARSGLRLMRDDQRPFFRLAVQQAEAAYNIRASHPVFLHWMEDATAELNAYADDARQYFLLGIFCFVVFQIVMVVLALVLLSKLYP